MASFAPFVELFSIDGINLAGNLDSGAVVGLTSQAMETCQQVKCGEVESGRIAQIDKRLHAYMSAAGFFETEPKFNHPLGAYVHVTQCCNLNCVGCYSMGALRNHSPDPSVDQLGRVFSQLACAGAVSVNISGGEPFLRNDLCDLVRLANEECGIASVNVVTNGTISPSFDLSELAKWVDSVTVSIDGPSSDSPALIRREQRFDMLMAMVGKLKTAGVATRILPTLHSRNIEDVPSYVRLAKDLGVGLSFSLLSCAPECAEMASLAPSASELERLAELQMEGVSFDQFSEPFGIALKARRSCGAGLKSLSFDVDGGVYPCHMLQSPQFLMGNIYEEDLTDILVHSRTLVEEWLLPVERVGSCSTCEYGLICGGGCRARTINCGAGPAGEDPYCSLSKGFYRMMFSALSASLSS